MLAANFAEKGIQQLHTTCKELTFHLWRVFEWTRCREKGNCNSKFTERKYETEIETEMQKSKFSYGNR